MRECGSPFVGIGGIMTTPRMTREQWMQHIWDCLEMLEDIAEVGRGVVEAIENVGEVMHDTYARPRPFPYDTTKELQLKDGGGADTFGAYAELIPKGTYNFGDTPNYVQVAELVVENLPANDIYVFEFCCSPDGAAFTPIGAIRTRRTAVFSRSFTVKYPCRPFNNDIDCLYGRLKDKAGGGTTVSFSLSAGRWVPPSVIIPISTGAWPLG